MINQYPARLQFRTIFQGIQNHVGPLELVFQMGSVNQDKLVEADGQVQMLFKNGQFP